jgi:hypothetical protein
VFFRYATTAGGPGDVSTEGIGIANPPAFGPAIEPWYIVKAKGNVNGDSTYSYCIGTSFSNELFWENEGE